MSTPDVPAVRTDPATGQKLFNTRAAKASAKIVGKGYDILDNAELKAMPEFKKDISFDEAAQAEQRAFIESRRGVDDYVKMEGQFARYMEDHYSSEPVPREALTDECDVVVVGAGFSGLMLWYKLSQAGFTDIRFCERGGDVGGTWYWNRYPGVACDVESYAYMPLLDETGYFPKQKYASGFEIFEYCQLIAERYGFYDHCLFHTEVTGVNWNDDTQRWTVSTARGDAMKARVVILANGILTTPRLARIEGMETFQGESFHTSRWDYNVELEGKRIGIIGTGATAVQAIPELAKVAGHLTVFQRTPSTIEVRDQRNTTPEQIERWKQQPGWALARRARVAEILDGRGSQPTANNPAVGSQASPVPSDKPRLSREERQKKQLNTGYRIMQQIRDRIDTIVEDPKTAAALKPYYAYACKRPTFHDEYLPTFNRPNVTLVDTAPLGVQQINERGVVHDGVQYDLDVLIYATGFDFMSRENVSRVTGSDGRSIADKWTQQGTRTFLGLHTAGFPNLLIISGPQAGGGKFNFIETIEEQSDYVTWLLKTMRDQGHHAVDVRQEDEDAWAEHCVEADIATAPLRDCVGNFNGYGRTPPGALGYYGGREAERRQAWAQETLEPYVFTPAP